MSTVVEQTPSYERKRKAIDHFRPQSELIKMYEEDEDNVDLQNLFPGEKFDALVLLHEGRVGPEQVKQTIDASEFFHIGDGSRESDLALLLGVLVPGRGYCCAYQLGLKYFVLPMFVAKTGPDTFDLDDVIDMAQHGQLEWIKYATPSFESIRRTSPFVENVPTTSFGSGSGFGGGTFVPGSSGFGGQTFVPGSSGFGGGGGTFVPGSSGGSGFGGETFVPHRRNGGGLASAPLAAKQLRKRQMIIQLSDRLCSTMLPVSESIYPGAAKGSDIECLRYLHANGFRWTTDTVVGVLTGYAASAKQIECLEFLHAEGCPFDDKCALSVKLLSPASVEILTTLQRFGCMLPSGLYTKAIIDILGLDLPCFRPFGCIDSASNDLLEKSIQHITPTAVDDTLTRFRQLQSLGVEMTNDTLQTAIDSGQIELVQYIISNGTIGWGYGKSLERCVSRGDVEMLRIIITSCFEPFVGIDRYGPRLCELAVSRGRLECLRFLHEQGCEPTDDLLHIALSSESFACAEYIVANGDPEELDLTSAMGEAARFRNMEMLLLLRQHGAEWPAPGTRESDSVLVMATANNDLEMVEYVMENGCPWDTAALAAAVGFIQEKGDYYHSLNNCGEARESDKEESWKCMNYFIQSPLCCRK